jgi:hypothetical protein
VKPTSERTQLGGLKHTSRAQSLTLDVRAIAASLETRLSHEVLIWCRGTVALSWACNGRGGLASVPACCCQTSRRREVWRRSSPSLRLYRTAGPSPPQGDPSCCEEVLHDRNVTCAGVVLLGLTTHQPITGGKSSSFWKHSAGTSLWKLSGARVSPIRPMIHFMAVIWPTLSPPRDVATTDADTGDAALNGYPAGPTAPWTPPPHGPSGQMGSVISTIAHIYSRLIGLHLMCGRRQSIRGSYE